MTPKEIPTTDELNSFMDDLRYAQKNKKDVVVYASGTYKGINGQIISIHAGTVVIQSAGKRSRLKISDIRRVEIFEGSDQND